MMHCGYARPPRHVGHRHCDSCFSRRCKAPVEISVSCALIPCSLMCGALFHMCKQEEHALLCPNEKVPCLNADFGCPLNMPRSWQAAHLQDCPASVVCCSMEWNRWPAEDAQSHMHAALQENLVKELAGGQVEALDLSMALRDQDHLFHSLKMKKLFPELVERVEEEEWEEQRRRDKWRMKKEEKKKREALEAQRANRVDCGFPVDQGWYAPLPTKIQEAVRERGEEEKQEREPTQEEREALARGRLIPSDSQTGSRYWECMFNMEKGGCMITEASEGTGSKIKGREKESHQSQSKTTAGTQIPTNARTHSDNTRHTHSDERPDPQCVACLAGPEKKQAYYYGQLEPMKIVTVRTFKIPCSFTAKHKRIRNPSHWKRVHVAVDTSDLGVELKDMPIWEEVQASLLCSLEKELRGHLIAESKSTDALLHDTGTQTYAFQSTPFGRNASLASVTAGRPLQLHLQVQAEGVTSRHNKTSSAFTFLCGHAFQRREFPKHFRNVHADIQSCASGWFEQRCPLAYLGCTFSQKRFQPSTHTATVTYNQELSCFSLRPTIATSLNEQTQLSTSWSASEPVLKPRRKRLRGGGVEDEDSLSGLPYEVLCYIASFLDSFSLFQLALVSCLMRDVCSSLLHERGMVSLLWEKKFYKTGLAKWKAKKVVWEFSTLFSPVEAWCFDNSVPSMSEHLKVCPYYEIEPRTERVLMLHNANIKINTGSESKSNTLVSLFQKQNLNSSS
ncbi:F-box only protein 40 [Esox lucius]|uniref:F-box protein 40, tandem duplicate 1 n=1 Tax=Esox lucius TaxID=8010 RepID=A0A3P8ZKR2_ESOLU|nr:F-box only protein 40 [Esox lucius]